MEDDRASDGIEQDEETSVPQGEFVLMIARGVGFLVAIVAIVLAMVLMMTVRTIIAFTMNKMGILGLSITLGVVLWVTLKCANAPAKSLWLILTRGCM